MPATGSRQERLKKFKKGPGGECPEKGYNTAALTPVIPSGLRSILISSPRHRKNIQVFDFTHSINLCVNNIVIKMCCLVHSSKLLSTGAMFGGGVVHVIESIKHKILE